MFRESEPGPGRTYWSLTSLNEDTLSLSGQRFARPSLALYGVCGTVWGRQVGMILE